MLPISIDNLIVISVVLSVYGTYCFCSKYLSDSTCDLKKNSDISLNLKNSPKSFSDFGIFLNEEEMYPMIDESTEHSKSCSAIQSSNLCSSCNRKLYKFNSIDYFAFDKQYCKSCWQRINYKMSKNY